MKRVYQEKKWACTTKTTTEEDMEGNSGMFWKLFGYINGGNDQGLGHVKLSFYKKKIAPLADGPLRGWRV